MFCTAIQFKWRSREPIRFRLLFVFVAYDVLCFRCGEPLLMELMLLLDHDGNMLLQPRDVFAELGLILTHGDSRNP